MASKPYYYYEQSDFRRGINQEPENAEPGQVIDALNMWAPDGLLQSRPGYVGYSAYPLEYSVLSGIETGESHNVWREDAGVLSHTVTNGPDLVDYYQVDLASLAEGDRFYIGWPTIPSEAVYLNLDLGNTNSSQAIAEYWNGSRWKTFRNTCNGFAGTGDINFFVIPTDWAQTDVGTGSDTNLYWFRYTITANALSAGVGLIYGDPNNSAFADGRLIYGLSAADVISAGILAVETLVGKSYIRVLLDKATETFPQDVFDAQSRLDPTSVSQLFITSDNTNVAEPPTVAVIPEYNRAFVAYRNNIVEVNCITNTAALAQPNNLPEIVGTIDGIKSPYHPDEVPQLTAFPKAKYITYFKGTLWAVEGDFTLRWAAPAIDGAYNVWPEDSFVLIGEADNSPITGLAILNEQLVVLKRDSIWLMVPLGVSDLDLPVYNAVKVVSGVGCVSQASAKAVRGRLILLSEDGIYSFNGTPAIEKISGPVDAKIAELNKARRPYATAVNWSANNCYMLACSLTGQTSNDFVFVYDYDHGAWWFFDNVPAQCWLLDEGVHDQQTLYFGDTYGRVFQFGIQQSDNGTAITSHFAPHRFGRHRETQALREAEVVAYQNIDSLTVTPIVDDQDMAARDLDFSASRETTYDGVITYPTTSLGSQTLAAGGSVAVTAQPSGAFTCNVAITDANSSLTAFTVVITGITTAGTSTTESLSITAADSQHLLRGTTQFISVSAYNITVRTGGAAADTFKLYAVPVEGLSYTKARRRARHIGVTQQLGRWFQTKISSTSKYLAMRIERIRLGVIRLGRR